MKKFAILIVVFVIWSFATIEQKSNSDRVVTQPSDENWISLFNGEDLTDWTVKIKGHPFGDNWKNTFRAVDGVLKVDYSNYEKFDNSFGHIFYKTAFSNYRLKLDYRFTGEQLEGGEGWALRNSGIMIHCQDPKTMKLDQNFPVCVEVQLLGGVDENEKRSTANLCTPGTHVQINKELVTTHCLDSRSETYYGEQWVNVEVEVFNDSLITHYVNGKKVLEYSHPIVGGEHNDLENSEGMALNTGFISLQSESHPVEFRNIMILELD